jgi:S-adenosylmethionine hydrolase
MIVLFTDFGDTGIYVGQMKAVLGREAPGVQVLDLLHDAPTFNARASAYLLASLVDVYPTDTIFLCVVDPGVGSERDAVVIDADGRHFVGPDNGLFEMVMRRANSVTPWLITWRPATLSASFHGRDLFAPVAARIARGEPIPGIKSEAGRHRRADWPDDLAEVIYIDRFGNAMTGLRCRTLPAAAVLEAAGRRLPRARTFSDLPPGTAFWYENSSGLAEIAVNQGRADRVLGLTVGAAVTVHPA